MRRTRAQRGFTVEQNGTMTSNSLSSCEVKHTEGTKLLRPIRWRVFPS
jgi:hypothetical protein